jgi:protein ImuB
MFACIHLAAPVTSADTNSLLQCASIFSPRIEETAAGTAVLDLEGLDRLFGSFERIAERLAEEARAFKLNASIAVASNPDAAVHLARGYAGLTVVEGGNEREKLSELDIDVLSPSPEILATLDRWGIRTLGALAALPAVQIAARLGQEGIRLHRLALGKGARLLVPRVEMLRFEETMDLDYLIESLEPLTFILARVLDRLCMRLQTRGMATHEITLRLILEKHGLFTRILQLPLPVHNARLLLKLFMLDLEAHPPGGAIAGVHVEAQHTRPRTIQKGLFVPLSPEPEKLELTLARIAGIVGEDNVGSPEILDSHRPEAFRVKHFNLNFGFRNSQENRDSPHLPLFLKDKKGVNGDCPYFPIRLFRPPLEATVQLSDGIPVWLAFSGFHGPIETASGPWKGSGDWWNGQRWDREAWDIEVLPSTLYRIYRDLNTNRWFADGVYD